MRKFHICLSIALMFTLNIFAQSQNNENSVTAELILEAAEGSKYTPVKNDDAWHGIENSTIAKIKLTINPRDIKDEPLRQERYNGYTITRYYGDSEHTLNQDTQDVITELAQGMNQQIVYDAVFHFQRRTRSSESSEWSQWEDMEDEVSNDNWTGTFHIYKTPHMSPFLHTQTNNEYITQVHIDQKRQFIAPYQEETGNPNGWNVSWELDGKSVGSEQTYTFSTNQTGEKKLLCTITNKAPDNNNIWFTHTEPINLTVYENVNGEKLTDYIVPPSVTANSTYTNKGECTYQVSIPEPQKYGKWIYTWERKKDGENKTISNNDGTLTDASFNPTERGTYKTSVTVKCVNPNDTRENPEVWYDAKHTFDDLQVYDNPTDITEDKITKVFPQGAKANTYYSENSETNNNNTYNYSVTIPNPNGENYGKWIYTWSRTKNNNSVSIDNKEPNTDNTADITLTTDERATYSTKLTLQCVNPNDKSENPEVWHEIKDIDFGTLDVYKNPNKLSESDFKFLYPSSKDKNLYAHTGQNNRGRKYSVNLQNADEYGKWIYAWSRTKNEETQSNPSNSNSFNIDNNVDSGVYKTTLSLKCVNPDNEDDVWSEPQVPQFESYTVYPEPQAPTVKKYKNGENTVVNFVFKNEPYTIKLEDYADTGNPDGWIFEWVKDNNTEPESTEATYTVTTTEETLSNIQPYIKVKGKWKNVSPYYYDSENPEKEVWKQDSTEEYHIYVCEEIDDPEIKDKDGNTPNLVYMERENLSFEIKEDPAQLPRDWSWEYTWISANDTLSREQTLNYTTITSNGKTNTPTITCDIKGITTDKETCYHFTPSVTLSVYPTPKCEEKFIHYNQDDKDSVYVMYVNDTFDASELFTESGGFTRGWTKILDVKEKEGYNKQDLNFTPNQVGTYNLNLSVKNEATLTDGNTATWFGDKDGNKFEKDYVVTVLERPRFDYRVSTKTGDKNSDEITNETNLTEDKEELKSIDIENGDVITIELTLNGGVNSSNNGEKKIEWEVKNGNTTLQKDTDYNVMQNEDTYTFTMTGKNETESNTTPVNYTLSYTIKNNPDHIINGSEFNKPFERTISVWKKFDAELAVEDFRNSYRKEDGCYVIETCEGLYPNNVETISLKSIGGSANKWTMTYTVEVLIQKFLMLTAEPLPLSLLLIQMETPPGRKFIL